MIIHSFREHLGIKVEHKLELHSVYQKRHYQHHLNVERRLETILEEWNVLTTYFSKLYITI